MHVRLVTIPLLATTLLLGTLGCSKKEADPAPPIPASGTGSYTMDGRAVTCKATCYKGSTATGLDVLVVYLFTTPQPAAGPEKLSLTFTKRPSEPVSAYESGGADLSPTIPNQPPNYELQPYTIMATSSGGYSGTFTGATSPYNPGHSVVTNGVFTDVHL